MYWAGPAFFFLEPESSESEKNDKHVGLFKKTESSDSGNDKQVGLLCFFLELSFGE